MTSFPEIVTAGIYNSDTVAKNITISKNRKTSMFEIELPIENGGLSYIDAEVTPITTNLIICAKPGQIRHTRFPFRCLYIHMVVQDPIIHEILMNISSFVEITNRPYYEKLFTEICMYHNTGILHDQLKLHSLILELIYAIRQDSANISNESKGNNTFAIEAILRYIKEHLNEDLSLENLSKEFSISPIYFHNSFKKAVGSTLHGYVEEQRIKKAITLLTATHLTLTRIAFECGFTSQSYFSFVFKRHTGKTPRQYTQELYKLYEL